MAINRPKVDIFHIDVFGNLKNSENENYLVLGSGKDEAEKYIEECIEGETFDSYNINIESAIRLCTGALKKARYDIFSGGPMDLVVVRSDKVYSYGEKIKNSLKVAEMKVLEEIIKDVKKNNS
jgi:20S proteasome alpha/beta subunit